MGRNLRFHDFRKREGRDDQNNGYDDDKFDQRETAIAIASAHLYYLFRQLTTFPAEYDTAFAMLRVRKSCQAKLFFSRKLMSKPVRWLDAEEDETSSNACRFRRSDTPASEKAKPISRPESLA